MPPHGRTIGVSLFIFLAFAGPGSLTPGDAGEDLIERLRKKPEEAEAIIVEARLAPKASRVRLIQEAGAGFSVSALSGAISRLQALKDAAADRWTLEILHHLPPGHEFRMLGPRGFAILWRQGAPARLLDSLAVSPWREEDLLFTLLTTVRPMVKSPDLGSKLWKLVARADAPARIRNLAAEALEGTSAKDFSRKVLRQYLSENEPRLRAALIGLLDPGSDTSLFPAVAQRHAALKRPGIDEVRALLRLAARAKSDDGLRVLRDAAIYAPGAPERTLAIRLLSAYADHPGFFATLKEIQEWQVNEPDVRIQVLTTILEVLVDSGGPLALEVVEEATRDRDSRVRLAAVHLLERFPAEKTIAICASLLDDPSPQVACGALWGLFRARKGPAIDEIFGKLETIARRGGLVLQEAARILSLATGKDLGTDAAAWLVWRKSQPAIPDGFGPKEAPSGRTTVGFFEHRIHSRHPLFVLDISSSMNERSGFYTRIEILYQELNSALSSLDETVLFSMIGFDDGVYPWPEGPKPATGENVKKALAFLRGIPRRGGTNYQGALEASLAAPEYDTVYFLSDGQPTRGKITQPDEIASWFRAENAKRGLILNTIGIEDSGALLKKMALENDGLYKPMTGRWKGVQE